MNKFRQWQRRWDNFNPNHLVAKPTSQAQFIKELKSDYYLDRMKHGK